jgi:hypothetical protein
MHGYIEAALRKFKHPEPGRPERATHTWNPPVYGAMTEWKPPPN